MPDAPGGRSPLRRGTLTLLAAAGVGGLILAHLEVRSRGPGYAGILLPLDHLFDAALAAGLLTVAVAVGLWILRRVGLEPRAVTERLLHSAAVGAGVLAGLFLVAGLAGALVLPVLLAVVLGAAGVARRELAELPPAVARAWTEARRAEVDPWIAGLAVAVTAGAALFLLLHGSLPPGDWDSLMYHLEIPRTWLREGRIHLPEDNLHAAFTGLVQLLYLPFLAAGSPAAAALLNGLFALLLAGAVVSVAHRFFGAETGAVATALVWASTGILLVAITPRVDVALAFFLLVGHGALVAALLDPDGKREHLLRAALVLGLAAGVKYHALAYAAALAPLALWALARGKAPAGGRGRAGALGVLVFGVAAAPWLLKNLFLLGAPLYPFFAERMIQPWLAELYGGAAVPEGVDPRVFGVLGQAREAFDPVALFLAPERLTVEQEAVHYHTNPLLLLLPLWVFRARSRALAAVAGPALIYALLVAVVVSRINLRYLFPAIAPLTVATAFLAVDLLKNRTSRGIRRAALALLVAGALVPTSRSAVTWTRQAPAIGHATGRVSAESYLSDAFPFYAGLVRAVNNAVPDEGRVLLLWEARGFYLQPPVLQDNVLTNWPLLVPWIDETGACLSEAGVTHVVASTGAVQYYRARGTDPELLGWPRFRRFAGRCLQPVARGGGWVLFRTSAARSGEGR